MTAAAGIYPIYLHSETRNQGGQTGGGDAHQLSSGVCFLLPVSLSSNPSYFPEPHDLKCPALPIQGHGHCFWNQIDFRLDPNHLREPTERRSPWCLEGRATPTPGSLREGI